MSKENRPERGVEREQRFERAFAATYPRVLAYALRRCNDRASAEDVVGETFAIAWRRFDVVPDDPLPWLLRTARNVMSNRRRASRRHELAQDAEPTERDLVDRRAGTPELIAEKDAFAMAFRALRVCDREVLTLVAWDGLEPRDAAKVMGCSATAFSIRLHRARRRLLKELRSTGHSLGEETGLAGRRTRPDTAEAG